MNLQFSFEGRGGSWSVKEVFNRYYLNFIKNNKEHNVTYVNSSFLYKGNPSSYFSPHIMVIKNLDNQKYIIVSYWDRAYDLTLGHNGWDHPNCVDLITSSGIHQDMKYTPFSYVSYDLKYDKLSKESKSIFDKPKTELFFRGKLYGHRDELKKTNNINIIDNILSIDEYFNELNENRISLSLNGAAEICNRDIEILSSKSVLLRLKLNQKFHNDLVPDFHYVSFEYDENPKTQSEIIIDKFNTIKNDIDYLHYISENGYKWYRKNGTVTSNVKILNNILNLEKLK